MAKKPSTHQKPRVVPREKGQRIQTIRIGHKKRMFGDSYVKLIDASWLDLALLIAGVYLAINVLFACAYMLLGEGIENVHEHNFSDVFFFSVQTFATIGYGKMVPVSFAANMMMTIEAMVSFGYYAVVTGLVFSKFSRPTARVLFSKVAVITQYDGVPHLMMRLANERKNRIVNANVEATMLGQIISGEGHKMRRFHDLKLVRSHAPFLQLSWTIMHPLDESSPLYGLSEAELLESDMEIIISLSGVDESIAQPIYARYSYMPEDIMHNAVFEDVIRRTDDQSIEINYTKFHEFKHHQQD